MAEIESACGIRFTGLVNNSNLGEETTAADVLASVAFGEEVSALTGLPVKMTAVKAELVSELEGKIPNLLPLTLQKKPI